MVAMGPVSLSNAEYTWWALDVCVGTLGFISAVLLSVIGVSKVSLPTQIE